MILPENPTAQEYRNAAHFWQKRCAELELKLTQKDTPQPHTPEAATPRCRYCGESRYFDSAQDYWRCQSKVDANDNHERSTICRLAEASTLRTALATAERKANEQQDRLTIAECIIDKQKEQIETAEARATKAEQALAIIGERAVVDFDKVFGAAVELSNTRSQLAEAQAACAAKDEALRWLISLSALSLTAGTDLLKRLEDAEKDTERLDFVEANYLHVGPNHPWRATNFKSFDGKGSTPRQAIDAARTQPNP